MVVYLSVSIALLLLGLAYESVNSITRVKYNKVLPATVFTIPSFILLFIISAFRGDFTTDYKNYTGLFDLYNRYSFKDLLYAGFQNEIGYIYLNKIIGIFTDDALYFS